MIKFNAFASVRNKTNYGINKDDRLYAILAKNFNRVYGEIE